MSAAPQGPRATLRFAEKRELILDGAARLFNRRGIKAGTLAEVAASVGLATNSLTYYYRKKEDLVCACLLRSIDAINQVIGAAAQAPTLPDRLGGFVHGFVALMAEVAEQRRPELVFFGDMRALPQPQAGPVFAAYVEMYRSLRRLLRPGQGDGVRGDPVGGHGMPGDGRPGAGMAGGAVPGLDARRALNARTHLLLAEMLWARAWLTRFEPIDYPQVAAAITDILLHGLAAQGQAWPAASALARLPDAPAATQPADDLADAYLRTATGLINDHGVGGASVQRIAAALALTKGSFYHHHDTKHGLIDACFERSFALIRRVQLAALGSPGNGWQRLLAATLPLVNVQDPALASGQGPLLRLTAWTELPGSLRWQKFSTMNQLGERYAALVTGGMIDGSIRLLDPAVAAQLINGMINGLAEAGHWVPAGGRQPLATLIARPLLLGWLAPAPSDGHTCQ